MNRMLYDENPNRGPKRLAIALAGVLVAGLTAVCLAGGESDGGPPPGDPPEDDDGGGIMMDDEAVGSLPIQNGDVVFLIPGAPGPELPPSFYIAGPTDALLAALIDAHGRGFLGLHPTAADGHSLAIVYGDLHLELDATLFTRPDVSAGLLVGAELRRTRAGLFVDGRLVARSQLGPQGRFPVPVGGLYQHGLLKDGADLYASQAGGARDHVRLAAFGGVVSLHQMN